MVGEENGGWKERRTVDDGSGEWKMEDGGGGGS
jgi:hypothetical protein